MAREAEDLGHLDVARDSVDRMERLIDDLLTLARQGQTVGETEQLSLGETVRLAWQQVETEHATLQTDDTLGTVSADSQRIRELLENLFRNAVEHGSASDASGAADSVAIHVSRVADDAATGFVVADDGPGIPAGDRDKVFDHGYTDDADGTGFGLSIVKNIVDAHGWSISVAESESGGARFEITGLD
jgi:signal transduction histidine kinase